MAVQGILLISRSLRRPLDQAAEGVEVEELSDEGVEVRDVRDDDGGAGFAHVPEDPQDALWFGKAVVSTEDCRNNLQQVRHSFRGKATSADCRINQAKITYNKNTKAENAGDNKLTATGS